MLRLTIEWTGMTGAPYYTTLHFGGSTLGEAGTAVTTVMAWLNLVDSSISNQLTANIQDDVYQVDVATGLVINSFPVVSAAVPMANVAEPLPHYTQVLHRLRTGVYVAGRELRGRLFLPGIVEADSINGIPAAPLLTYLASSWNSTFGAMASSNTVQVYSPTHHQAENVQNMSLWSQFALLRSRRD
jgi:hypothetical protein